MRRLGEERAIELGLTIIETPLELSRVPGLSGPDRACLYFVVSEGWTCIANDRVLRKECKKQGGKVVWGIEMLLKLVSAKQISAARAVDVAEEISRANPEITDKIVTEFRKKLSSL